MMTAPSATVAAPRLGVFGCRAQRSRQALVQIAGAPPAQQSDLVRAALDIPSHRGAVLDLLDSGALDGMAPRALNQALGSTDGWGHRQRRRIAAWFLKRDSALFDLWAERTALYPGRDERSGASALAHHALARRLTDADLPYAVHCDFETRLGALAEMAGCQRFADLRLGHFSDWESLQRLLAVALEIGAYCTLAGLFHDGILDGHCRRAEVQTAFHRLDWLRFGSVKLAVAGRTVLPDRPQGRFAGVQLWAQGQPGPALDLLLAAADRDPGQATLREAALAAAAAGRVDVRLERLVQSHASTEFATQLGWLMRLAQPGARLGERDLEALANFDFPPATDPLFGALALGIVRALPAVLRNPGRWAEVRRRLSERNPRWRRDLPLADREWFTLLREFRQPRLSDAALTVLLRRALLLPVVRSWIVQLFASLHREDRPQRLARRDGTPTDLGLLVSTLCIRTVDQLPGILLGTPQEEQALLSSEPLVVLGAVSAALDRPTRDGRIR